MISNTLEQTILERAAVKLPGNHLSRLLTLGLPADGDNQRFPVRILPASSTPFQLPRELQDWPFSTKNPRSISNKVPLERGAFEDFLTRNGTTSLLVVRDGVLVYERYFQGRQAETPVGLFSVTKSIMLLLVGLALRDGIIGSLDELVLDYLPELKPNGFTGVTIRHLLNMTAGLKYKHAGSPWAGGARAYYNPNREAMLFRYARTYRAPDTAWLYSDYNPMLLALILTRLTGQTISQYAATKLFEPLGMPHFAEWLLDHDHGMEHSAGGFYATPLTLAIIGEMVRNQGRLGGKQIVSSNWIEESTTISPTDGLVQQNVITSFFEAAKINYKHYWWIWAKDGLPADFSAIGLYGQYIYISPKNNTVVVRTGTTWGRFGST